MDRRQLLQMIAAATGTAFIAGNARAWDPVPVGENVFSQDDATLLNELGEAILPATDTPGAREADVGAFITQYVSDCYDAEQRARFAEGLSELRTRVQDAHGGDLAELDADTAQSFVQRLDEEVRAAQGDEAPEHWFTMMKQLVILGFFTSEVGGTQVLRYVQVPGRYDGCVDYDGGPAWAT